MNTKRTIRSAIAGGALVIGLVAGGAALAAPANAMPVKVTVAAPTLAQKIATLTGAFEKAHPAGSKVGNGQCVTLWHQYNKEVLGWTETGTPGDAGAHELWDDFAKKAGMSAHYDKVSAKSKAREGDVAIYSTAVGHGYGHVAIVLKDNGSTLKVMQQNWTKSLHVSVDSSMTKAHLLGYLRPKTAHK